ncbi:MAG: hypothetical protein JRN39_07780 [Nitrososphaerota archaeon]|nr:hypothetical protein [Nitrososphaerota archaeon]
MTLVTDESVPRRISFMAKIRKVHTRKGKSYFIYRLTVPKRIPEHLSVRDGDVLLVTVKKADPEDVEKARRADLPGGPSRDTAPPGFATTASTSPHSVKRSPLEVRIDILRAVKEGARRPTQIMFRANLSWAALVRHLEGLVEGGYLHEMKRQGSREYEITKNGYNVLSAFQDTYRLLASPWRE